MTAEKSYQEGDTPKEVYETTDGTPLQGTLREVFPQLDPVWGWSSVSLEDVMQSNTVVGEALRRSLTGKTVAVSSRYRSDCNNPPKNSCQ